MVWRNVILNAEECARDPTTFGIYTQACPDPCLSRQESPPHLTKPRFERLQGFCYINYSTPEAAGAAIGLLNGAEFPLHSGHRIKVMFAEPLGAQPQQQVRREREGGRGL